MPQVGKVVEEQMVLVLQLELLILVKVVEVVLPLESQLVGPREWVLEKMVVVE
jgi:hypothetical protein